MKDLGKDGIVKTEGSGMGTMPKGNSTAGEGTSVGNIRGGKDKVKNGGDNKTSC